jgi:hypothetical protein
LTRHDVDCIDGNYARHGCQLGRQDYDNQKDHCIVANATDFSKTRGDVFLCARVKSHKNRPAVVLKSSSPFDEKQNRPYDVPPFQQFDACGPFAARLVSP